MEQLWQLISINCGSTASAHKSMLAHTHTHKRSQPKHGIESLTRSKDITGKQHAEHQVAHVRTSQAPWLFISMTKGNQTLRVLACYPCVFCRGFFKKKHALALNQESNLLKSCHNCPREEMCRNSFSSGVVFPRCLFQSMA